MYLSPYEVHMDIIYGINNNNLYTLNSISTNYCLALHADTDLV